MRVCCIGDLHGRLPAQVPECDLLLIAGDLGPDDPDEAERWLRGELIPWLEDQAAAEIVAVAGNHDFLAAASPAAFRALPWRYLEHEAATVSGVHVFGTAYSMPLGEWPFQARDDELAALWRRIPEETEVLVVHGPPYGYRDTTVAGVSSGSRTLLARILELPRLRLVCTGHIHEARGQAELPTGAVVVNASLVNVRFELVHEPIVVDL